MLGDFLAVPTLYLVIGLIQSFDFLCCLQTRKTKQHNVTKLLSLGLFSMDG